MTTNDYYYNNALEEEIIENVDDFDHSYVEIVDLSAMNVNENAEIDSSASVMNVLVIKNGEAGESSCSVEVPENLEMVKSSSSDQENPDQKENVDVLQLVNNFPIRKISNESSSKNQNKQLKKVS